MSAPVRRTPYSATPVEPSSGLRLLRGWWIPDLAFSTMRLGVGLLLAWHGAHAHFGVLRVAGAVWRAAPVPFTEPWIDATVKLAGGLLLAVGLFTRPAAFLLAALVLLEHYAANGIGRAWMMNGGELATVYALVLLALTFTGAGLFSADALIDRYRARRTRMTVSMSPWIRRQIRRRELTR